MSLTKLLVVLLVVAVLFAATDVAAYAAKGGVKGAPEKASPAPGQQKKAPAEPTVTADPVASPTPEPTAAPVQQADPAPEPEKDGNKGRIWVLKAESNGHNPKVCIGTVAYRTNDSRYAGKTVEWRYEPHGGPNAGSGSDSGFFTLDAQGNGSASFELSPGMYRLYGKAGDTHGGEKHKVVKCEPVEPPESPVEPPRGPNPPEPPENPGSGGERVQERTEARKTRRVRWESLGNAVEVWDEAAKFLDETELIGEALDVYEWDAVIGATYYVLAWNSREGHSGAQYLITILEEGETIEIHNPFIAADIGDGYMAIRLNGLID